MPVDSSSNEPQFILNDGKSIKERVYEFGDFRVDALQMMLYRDGHEVSLAPKVVETLVALVESPGTIISKEELFERLWKDSFVDESNLTQNIYLLRKTLGDLPDGRPMIETFRRRGYRFNGTLNRTKDGIAYRAEPEGPYPGRRNGLYLLLAGIAAVSAAAFVGAFLWRGGSSSGPPGPVSPNVVYSRLTQGANVFSPAVSPDGKFVAYCSFEPNGQSLLVKDLAGGTVRRLNEGGFKSCNSPLFSRDGTQIFYVDQNNRLMRKPLSGEAETVILQNEPNPFTFSPDGKQIAFVRGKDLVTVAADGSGERVLSSRDGETRWYSSLASRPAWSPDGKRIAVSGGYYENGKKFTEIVEVILETGAERRLLAPRWDSIHSVVWSGIGSELLVTARERIPGPMQIWGVSYPDGRPRRITNDLQSYGLISVSDDSRMLVAEMCIGASNVWIGELGDPASFRQLTFDDGDVTGRSGLAFAGEDKVLFTAAYSGNLDIWQINIDGSETKQITSNAGDRNIRQQTTPDGKYIVFASRAVGSTRRSIWRANADGTNPIELTRGGQDYPGLSPDGMWVYFTDISVAEPSIWKLPIEGGEPLRVTAGYPAFIPSVSPDGSRIAFMYGGKDEVADSGQLAVLDLNGGQPVLFDAHPFRGITHWSPDGASILFIEKGSPNLWRQPVTGGPPQQVTNLGLETTWNFAVSPASKRIVISRGNAASEAVLLTNF